MGFINFFTILEMHFVVSIICFHLMCYWYLFGMFTGEKYSLNLKRCTGLGRSDAEYTYMQQPIFGSDNVVANFELKDNLS